MSSPVKRKLSSLSKAFRTTINSAHIRLLICMDAFVLLSVLIESKLLVTESACKALKLGVDKQVSGKGKFCCENIWALITLIDLIKSHLFNY